jgi:hypothetical protein
MKHQQTRLRSLLLTGLCVAAALTIAAILRLHRAKPGLPSRRQVTISMDAQGRTQIGGVSVANTNVRDSALKLMDKLDLEPVIIVPRTMTNAQQASNFIQTLESLQRAGVSRQKTPNPYE